MHGGEGILIVTAIVCFTAAFASGLLISENPMRGALAATGSAFIVYAAAFLWDGDWVTALLLALFVAALMFVPALLGSIIGQTLRLWIASSRPEKWE